jgi:antitoxin component YwqK of YwqJK toxin-antitoxin module
VKEQGEYTADKKNKEWKEYDADGKLVSTSMYRAGKLITGKP